MERIPELDGADSLGCPTDGGNYLLSDGSGVVGDGQKAKTQSGVRFITPSAMAGTLAVAVAQLF